ncbi:SDR family oxidoreductase [Brevibacterium yomogidense]|uniref:SDR family oxidoreductase n=1 Tax=Brevibacterium yomogidense TaxID=946573 RepID=UPI0018E02916|nr:SDR family oxidoreductase [Brevibacterium yomogidense]
MHKIIVFGGHGKVALLTNRKLVDSGYAVTATIRSADQVAAIEATGAAPLVLDLQEATTAQLAEVISEHDAVVWSAGAGGAGREFTFAVDRDAAIRSMDAAERASVTRYIMVSYQGSSPDHGFPQDHGFYPYVQAKTEADAHLRSSGLEWTVLGPGFLTDDEPVGTIGLGPIEEFGGDRRGPGPNGERNISRSDVAQTIVDALDIASTVRKTIEYGRGSTPIRMALAR